MAFETNDLSGSLFKNERKATDRHPDYNGSCKIEGKEYWIAGWIKTSKAGRKFMSLAFTVKDEQPSVTKVEASFDDDIPF